MESLSPSRQRYLLPCPCGQRIPVSLAEAGGTVRCGACGAELAVPTYRELKSLEPAAADANAPPRRPSNWTGWHRRILLGSVVTLVALALAAICHASRPRLQSVDQLPFQAVWLQWQELRQGLDRFPSREERRYVEESSRATLLLAVALSIAGCAFVFTTVSFLRRNGLRP